MQKSNLFAEGYTPQDLRGHIAQIAGTYESEQINNLPQTVPHRLGQEARAFKTNSQLVSLTALHTAAPELLEALKQAEADRTSWVCTWAQQDGKSGKAEMVKAQEEDGLLPLWRAAIAKAEGRP